MSNSFQILMPDTDATCLHGVIDKPSVSGFNFMEESRIEFYNAYHLADSISQKLSIANKIIQYNKEFPPQLFWQDQSPQTLPGEVWRPILLWRGHYEASSFGRIRCRYSYENAIERLLDSPRIIKQHPNKEGYLSSGINRGRKDTFPYRINRLIATAFYENQAALPQVNHIDANKANNNSINLHWADRSFNMRHANGCGLVPFSDCDSHHNRALTKDEVLEVYNSKDHYYNIEAKFKITHSTIVRIKTGQTYIHLTGGKENRSRTKRLTEENIVNIYLSKEPTASLSKLYQVGVHTIQRIRNGENYTNITNNINESNPF